MLVCQQRTIFYLLTQIFDNIDTTDVNYNIDNSVIVVLQPLILITKLTLSQVPTGDF